MIKEADFLETNPHITMCYVKSLISLVFESFVLEESSTSPDGRGTISNFHKASAYVWCITHDNPKPRLPGHRVYKTADRSRDEVGRAPANLLFKF